MEAEAVAVTAAAEAVAIATADDCDSRPGQELLVAWNTVSTGLVPPAALGLVRPGKGWRARRVATLHDLGSWGLTAPCEHPVMGLPPSSAI